MPGPHPSHLINLQYWAVGTAPSRVLIAAGTVTIITAAAAVYFLGGMTTTVRNRCPNRCSQGSAPQCSHVSLALAPVNVRVGTGGSKFLSDLRSSGYGAQPRLALHAN